MSNLTLGILVKVVAVGIPALLIVLGFFAYVSGVPMEMLSGSSEIKTFGLILMVIGIGLYIIEFIVYLLKEFEDV